MTMEIHTKPKSATKPHSGGERERAALNAAQARTRVCSQSTCARAAAAAVERERERESLVSCVVHLCFLSLSLKLLRELYSDTHTI
jgi:hypothetical protein